MNKIDITVILVTRNRPLQIIDCVKSILKSSFKDYQILIADQSTNNQTVKTIKSLHSSKIEIVKMKKKGKARGLNLLVKKSESNILAFTDDDCIVSKSWLHQIIKTYDKFPNLAGIFGNVYPYKPKNHSSEICPSTFKAKKMLTHTFEKFHYYQVGLGNNMSIKKSVIEKVGNFQEWLGPGSIATNGEESELIFKILKQGFILATNPKVFVFHNRWLNYKQEKLIQANYTQGFISFLAFYLFTKDQKHAWKFIKVKINERIFPTFKNCLRSLKDFFKESWLLFFEVFAVFKGISIGLIMAINKKIIKLILKI